MSETNFRARERIDVMKIKKMLCRIGMIVLIVLAGICFWGKRNIKNPIVLSEEGEENRLYNGKEYVYKENLINILCMGIDKEEQMALRNDVGNSVGQADAIFLVSIDLEEKVIRVIAIPRDTMVLLQIYNEKGAYIGSETGQLCVQYAYGDGMERSANLMVKQVSYLLQELPIHAYVAINVHSLWMLNEAVGGVDMYMEEDYTALNPAFEKGTVVHLSGKLLENYIRERDTSIAGSAYTRMHRLKQYMLEYFKKAKAALAEDPTLPLQIFGILEKDMETDITADEIAFLVTNIMQCSLTENGLYTLPGEQIQGEEYEEFYVEESAAEELIINLFYEEK